MRERRLLRKGQHKILRSRNGNRFARGATWNVITQGIAGVRPKPSLAHVTARHSRGALDQEIDEALWAAYRRYDKSAVTQNLLRRYLTPSKAIPGRRNFHS